MDKTFVPLVLLGLMLISSGYVVMPARAADTNACLPNQTCYYGYDTSGNYARFPNPYPSYWQTSYNGQQEQIPTATLSISTQGFPSDYTTSLIMDGNPQASLAGGATVDFQIKGDDVHTFTVSSYVTGQSGERFYTQSNSWTSQKGKQVSVTTYTEYDMFYGGYGGRYSNWYYYPYYVPSTDTVSQAFDQSYTFTYQPQYQLTVQNDFGGSVSQAGWYCAAFHSYPKHESDGSILPGLKIRVRGLDIERG